jgi:von Willebrand factor type A domain/von Willebrand factor type A C-terminal domain
MSSTFTGVVHQNKFLARDATEVNAIVSIKSAVAASAAQPGGKLVVGFVGDGSGSMSGEKWRAAKQALIDSVGKLPDSCEFFVIIGRSAPDIIVPAQRATADNKAAALDALAHTKDEGGTAFAAWLRAARGEFAKCAGTIKVLVFLTDGENSTEDNVNLAPELGRCAGQFEVESRGVGDAYRPDQLRMIQHALGGSVDIIRRPEDLSEDFAAILERATGLAMSDVFVQIWTPVGAKLAMVKQFGREILDLTPKIQPGPNPRTQRIPTGNWGEETRDFHVVVQLDGSAVGKVGDTKLCARVGLIHAQGGQETEVKLDAGGQVVAIWTDDERHSAVINPRVANYSGQAELAERIQEGIRALEGGNQELATQALQRANALAEQTGHEATRKLIRKLADVDERGTLRIKQNVNKMDVKELDTRSTRTARTRKLDA